MVDFFKIADIISAFKKVHNAWLIVNTEDWYSKELIESIEVALKYVDQLASCVSHDHSKIEIEINIDIQSLKGKQFATVLKSTDEWKVLKKYMSKGHICIHQTSTIRGLFDVIHQCIRDFVNKM